MKRKFILMMAVVLSIGLLCISCESNNDNAPDPTPQPTPTAKARHTIIVYGQVGADMDPLMEQAIERCKPLLTGSDVRMFICYQYGNADGARLEMGAAKYGKPSQVVFFELTKDTDLNTISQTAKDGKTWSLTDPKNMTDIINTVYDKAPADQYSLVIYGHGGGYDPKIDCPDEIRRATAQTRATLYDEWSIEKGGNMAMNMYELSKAIADSKIPHFNTLFFHSCLMANVECLYDIYTKADYIIASANVLAGIPDILPAYVGAAYKATAAEQMARLTFEGMDSAWRSAVGEMAELGMGGDIKLIKSDKLTLLPPVCKRLANRLAALYPTQKEAIDKAVKQSYLYLLTSSLKMVTVDLLDYANQLCTTTGDSELKTIAADMKKALDEIILQRSDISAKGPNGTINEYSFTVVLTNGEGYQTTVKDNTYTLQQAYEYTQFHKLSDWGKWLQTNTTSPLPDMSFHGETQGTLGLTW